MFRTKKIIINYYKSLICISALVLQMAVLIIIIVIEFFKGGRNV